MINPMLFGLAHRKVPVLFGKLPRAVGKHDATSEHERLEYAGNAVVFQAMIRGNFCFPPSRRGLICFAYSLEMEILACVKRVLPYIPRDIRTPVSL